MTWLESTGGPLVLLPRSRLASWTGNDGSDYEDACTIYEYTGILSREWGDVLVVGAEPNSTTVIDLMGGPAILRWVSAPDEAAMFQAVAEFDPRSHAVTERVSFQAYAEPYILVDSVQTADQWPGIELHLPPGASQMLTYVVTDKGRQVSFVLHWFE